jgi:hypothetical protein
MKKSDAELLAGIIHKEINNPADVQQIYADTQKLSEEFSHLVEFLSTKDRQHRRIFYLRSEKRWFNLFGWTMAKTLMLLGIIAGGLFFLSKGSGEIMHLIYFIFGASSYYFLLYIVSLRKFRKNKKIIHAILSDYKEEIKSILESLVKEHRLDPEKYKV